MPQQRFRRRIDGTQNGPCGRPGRVPVDFILLRNGQTMRRKDKEITLAAEIEDIIAGAVVCRLAMVDGDRPYVVPLCFGYENRTLYFHTGRKGKKIEVLQKNPNVCFEFDEDVRVLAQPEACDWGLAYRSVIGYGKASFVTSPEGKRRALDIIMRHYGGSAGTYPDIRVDGTRIIRVCISRMTGKYSPVSKS
jgi:nitroimidazol reductase NimA-like FMN-containing flavoprotein (pyridoxamine 5'-phosphate oxidase superfamily)